MKLKGWLQFKRQTIPGNMKSHSSDGNCFLKGEISLALISWVVELQIKRIVFFFMSAGLRKWIEVQRTLKSVRGMFRCFECAQTVEHWERWKTFNKRAQSSPIFNASSTWRSRNRFQIAFHFFRDSSSTQFFCFKGWQPTWNVLHMAHKKENTFLILKRFAAQKSVVFIFMAWQ